MDSDISRWKKVCVRRLEDLLCLTDSFDSNFRNLFKTRCLSLIPYPLGSGSTGSPLLSGIILTLPIGDGVL